jgi:salicylate hydroxylase
MTDSAHEGSSAEATGPRAPVLIAGGGIGGLAAALALAQADRRSRVFEKRSGHDEEGAGIQIGPNGTRLLKRLGLEADLETAIAVPAHIAVMDGMTGRELTRLPLGDWIDRRHGAPYWVLHRADLHRALAKAVARQPLITLQYGREALSTTSQAASAQLAFADGSSESGAAVIVADGLWSRLRRAVFASPKLEFTGKSAMRAVIAGASVPPGIQTDVTYVWLRPGAHIVHYPVRGGREIAIVAVFDDATGAQTWASDVAAGTVTQRARGFPALLHDLLEAPRQWRKWSLYRQPASGPWCNNRIALLGDAAHPILPFLAQGGVMALEDAAALGSRLGPAPDAGVAEALSAYERDRRARAQAVVAASTRNGWIYHLDGPARMARDAVLAFSPPERLMAGYDWLYGWKD